jgi:asparagine synthase (glutamine-hydrolysing)
MNLKSKVLGGLILVGCASLYGCAGQHSEAALQQAGADFQKVKEAARLVIPSEVIDRKKGYFPVPGLKHLQGDTLDWVRELLLDPSQDRGLFNPAMLDRLLTDPQGQLTPLRGSKLWQLAALNLWLSEQGI